jgi:GAF domain-containing protein
VLRPFMRAWARQRISEFPNVPTPLDSPRAHAAGPDPDRILVFGTPATIGSGVLTHAVGLLGNLARELSRRTGRGVDVDLHADADLRIETAVSASAGLSAWRYDAILLVLGGADALRLTGVDVWRRELGVLLDALAMESSVSTRVFVVGIPPLSDIPTFGGPFGRIGDRHARALNAATAEVCEATGAEFVPLPAQGSRDSRYRTAGDYQAWASIAAERLCVVMAQDEQDHDDRRSIEAASGDDMATMQRTVPDETARQRREGAQHEDERQAALDALRILDTEPEIALDTVVASAAAAFGTRYAAFTLIDHDRQWIKSRVGFGEAEGHAVDELCVQAIRHGRALVVPDVGVEPRRADPGPGGQDHVIRFFAGQPVESPSGHRIGVLCVFDSEPREPGSLEETQLAAFAHAIQEQIWRRGVRSP